MTQENLNEEMNCQTSKARPLCSNNCSCCGSTATKNICYKCYEELPKRTEVPADGLLEVSAICSAPEVIIKSSHAEPDSESTKPSLLTPRISNRNMAVVLAKTNSSRIQHRCFSCKKRVGLTGFRCRCGDVFCASHRYSDKHVCSFDYKVAGRDAIFKENPVIRAAKIQKI